MSLELTGVHGLLKRHKLFTHKKFIVNDIRIFVFVLAGATVYGSCKRRKQKFVMSFTIAAYCKSKINATCLILDVSLNFVVLFSIFYSYCLIPFLLSLIWPKIY